MNTIPQHDHEEGELHLAGGDLLVGANRIKAFLVELGMPEHVDIYYLRRTGRWPIGKTGGEGGNLIASKRRLIRHAAEITRGSTAA
jgi:hypothetical protein